MVRAEAWRRGVSRCEATRRPGAASGGMEARVQGRCSIAAAGQGQPRRGPGKASPGAVRALAAMGGCHASEDPVREGGGGALTDPLAARIRPGYGRLAAERLPALLHVCSVNTGVGTLACVQ
jgi:hypothetical protein